MLYKLDQNPVHVPSEDSPLFKPESGNSEERDASSTDETHGSFSSFFKVMVFLE